MEEKKLHFDGEFVLKKRKKVTLQFWVSPKKRKSSTSVLNVLKEEKSYTSILNYLKKEKKRFKFCSELLHKREKKLHFSCEFPQWREKDTLRFWICQEKWKVPLQFWIFSRKGKKFKFSSEFFYRRKKCYSPILNLSQKRDKILHFKSEIPKKEKKFKFSSDFS